MKAMFWMDSDNKYAVCKDGSERLNVTLETEFVTDDNIIASDRLAMLSDAYGSVQKVFDDTKNMISYTRSYIAKDWCVWRTFALDNVLYGSRSHSWMEILAMFPSLTIVFKNGDLEAREAKEYSDTEMCFSWTNPDSKCLNVHIKKISWETLEDFVKCVYGLSSSEAVESLKTIYTDGIWPYPKVSLSISVVTGINSDSPTTVIYNDIGVYLFPISPDDTKVTAATNIHSVASNGKDLVSGTDMAAPFANIINLIEEKITGDKPDSTTVVSQSFETTLCKSIVNYNAGGSKTTSFAVAFPFFYCIRKMERKGETVGNYVTDYYFDEAGQPNPAFKSLGGIDLNKEGLVITNLAGWKAEEISNGEEISSEYKRDGKFSPSIMYSSEIISHLNEVSSAKVYMQGTMIWAHKTKLLAENDTYIDYDRESLESVYTIETVSDDQADTIASFSDGKVKFTFPFTVPAGGSVALFILEDSKYKFVFGMNNMTGADTNTMTLYVSLVEDRCKTVYDIHMDPICSITDYASSKFTYGKANYVVGGSGTGGSSGSGRKKIYKYVDGNGAVVQSGRCNEDGSVPDYIGDTPKKDDSGGYTYEFVEWGDEVDKNGNITRTAKFKGIKKKTAGDEINGTDWISLHDLWVKLGNPPTVTMSASDSTDGNFIDVFVKKDYGDTLGWDSDAATATIYLDDDDNGISGYRFRNGISTGTMTYEEKGTVAFAKFGYTAEYQAFRNKVYGLAIDIKSPSEWFANNKYVKEWNNWNEDNNGVEYKYFQQYDSDSNACALYEYNGTGDLADEGSWTKLDYVDHPTDMTIVEENRTFSLDNDTIASAIFIRGFSAK